MIERHECRAPHQPRGILSTRRPPAPACRGLIAVLVVLLGSVGLARTANCQPVPSHRPTGMDQAIALLNEARMHFRKVRDYECRMVERERVNGELLPETVMTMKVRNKPFSIYLRCESPYADKGLEVCYVKGWNQGMMRVHPTGIVGILGFWSVDPQDPRAFEKNRHCITEAGFGNLLESMARYWDMEHRLNKTLVHITDDEIDDRTCTRIETIHPGQPICPSAPILMIGRGTKTPWEATSLNRIGT
jgi:hypothetical protein